MSRVYVSGLRLGFMLVSHMCLTLCFMRLFKKCKKNPSSLLFLLAITYWGNALAQNMPTGEALTKNTPKITPKTAPKIAKFVHVPLENSVRLPAVLPILIPPAVSPVIPTVIPPVQSLDPNQKQVLTFVKRPPQMQQAWVLSNGHIRVAWLTANVTDTVNYPVLNTLARGLLERAFKEHSELSEVDISIYPQKTVPWKVATINPLFTLSVPKNRLAQVLALPLKPSWSGFYDRVYYAFESPVRQAPLEGIQDESSNSSISQAPESTINYQGTPLERSKLRMQHKIGKIIGGIRGGLLARGTRDDKHIALTIDDGPHPMYAPLLLDTLEQNHIKATCFIIGRNAEAYPYFVRDLLVAGQEIGNHTYNHRRLKDLSAEQIAWEIRAGSDALKRITGQSPRYFRPPGGHYGTVALEETMKNGMALALWTDDPGDFIKTMTEDNLKARMVRNLSPGGIILVHENIDKTINSIPYLVRNVEKRGWQLGSLSEMLGRPELGKVSPLKILSKIPLKIPSSLQVVAKK